MKNVLLTGNYGANQAQPQRISEQHDLLDGAPLAPGLEVRFKSIQVGQTLTGTVKAVMIDLEAQRFVLTLDPLIGSIF
jgi:hypothetical protein